MKQMDATLNEDMLSRLQMMATDNGHTWDLSPKDQAAIQYSLDQLKKLRELLQDIRDDEGFEYASEDLVTRVQDYLAA